MAFCPFYNLECPEDFSCAIWTKFGCCIIEKPGTPARYAKTGGEVDVYILQVLSSNSPPPQPQFVIVFAYDGDGTIHTETDLSKFTIYRIHEPNSRG